jgi:hypothetical protein
MTTRSAVTLLAAAVLLAGAEGGGCRGDRDVPVRVVASDMQCGGEGEGVSARRLASAADLAAAMAGAPAGTADFAKEAVILVAAGRKSTAGHGIALAADKAPVKDEIAGVRVTRTSPASGTMNAQVVTSPCIVVALPLEGLGAVGVIEGDQPVAKVSLK